MTTALLVRPPREPPVRPRALARASAEPAHPLSGAFATPPDPNGILPTPATEGLVRSQVASLLEATPSYHQLAGDERRGLEDQLVRVAAYAAECLRDIYWQSEILGQTPVLKETRTSRPVTPVQPSPALATAQANDFKPRAASQIGNITQQTLRAIAFPTFVADLIRGTFDAIFQANIKQMEAFGRLLGNVSKTVDQFMEDNVTDEHADAWLADTYPKHLQMKNGKAVGRAATPHEPRAAPALENELHTSASLDDSSIEETLVPAARRRMAETRLQMLSTMVLLGINRIVVTAGKIRATMAFHIDTSDGAFERTSEDVDARVAMRGQYNALVWGVEASASLGLREQQARRQRCRDQHQHRPHGRGGTAFQERLLPGGTLRQCERHAHDLGQHRRSRGQSAADLRAAHRGGAAAAARAGAAQARTPADHDAGRLALAARTRTAGCADRQGDARPGANNPVPEPAAEPAKDETKAKEEPNRRTKPSPRKSPRARRRTRASPLPKTSMARRAARATPPTPRPSPNPKAKTRRRMASAIPAKGLPWTVH